MQIFPEEKARAVCIGSSLRGHLLREVSTNIATDDSAKLCDRLVRDSYMSVRRVSGKLVGQEV